jgi:peptidoglycan hydrolase-like protein with peptidoglycan-binding domain
MAALEDVNAVVASGDAQLSHADALHAHYGGVGTADPALGDELQEYRGQWDRAKRDAVGAASSWIPSFLSGMSRSYADLEAAFRRGGVLLERADRLRAKAGAPWVKTPDAVVLGKGGSGAVAAAQKKLNARGWTPVLVKDGIIGEKTRAAIRWFQQASGLSQTGSLDPQTASALASARELVSVAGEHMDHMGYELWGHQTGTRFGADLAGASSAFGDLLIMKAQSKLNLLGEHLAVDGVPGHKTGAAVARFQGRQGLPPTGFLDAATLAAIDAATSQFGGDPLLDVVTGLPIDMGPAPPSVMTHGTHHGDPLLDIVTGLPIDMGPAPQSPNLPSGTHHGEMGYDPYGGPRHFDPHFDPHHMGQGQFDPHHYDHRHEGFPAGGYRGGLPQGGFPQGGFPQGGFPHPGVAQPGMPGGGGMNTWARWQQVHPGTPYSDYQNWFQQYGQTGATINGEMGYDFEALALGPLAAFDPHHDPSHPHSVASDILDPIHLFGHHHRSLGKEILDPGHFFGETEHHHQRLHDGSMGVERYDHPGTVEFGVERYGHAGTVQFGGEFSPLHTDDMPSRLGRMSY